MNNLILFDLDGTLIDTPSAIVEVFGEVLASMGAQARPASEIRSTIGLPLEQAFSLLLEVPVNSDQVGTGVKLYQNCFKERILPKANDLIFPGVVKGLKSLHQQGFILTIATSKFYSSADVLLKASGLQDYFKMVVGADQVKKPKPDPEVGCLIMKTFGISPKHTVMVGDTTHDLFMAKAAGMHSIAVTYGVHSAQELQSASPTWMASSFDQVVEQIESQGLES